MHGPAGLATLLQKLETDAVPKDPAFTRAAVNDWWRSQFDEVHGVRNEPETLVSNWFKLENLPAILYGHELCAKNRGSWISKPPRSRFQASGSMTCPS